METELVTNLIPNIETYLKKLKIDNCYNDLFQIRELLNQAPENMYQYLCEKIAENIFNDVFGEFVDPTDSERQERKLFAVFDNEDIISILKKYPYFEEIYNSFSENFHDKYYCCQEIIYSWGLCVGLSPNT